MPLRGGQAPLWLHGKFRGCGYRLTAPRQAILDVLGRTGEHLSAEDIYLEVHKLYPAIGLTTVYRTLELLVETGIVFKFDFGDGKARYELAEGPESIGHHHHIVCTGCRRIVDYTDFIDQEIELLKRTEEGLSKKYKFKITNHLIQFYGLCDKCQKQE
jgi:Fur family transcriptional regulator, ferric uptake regulator